MEIQCFSLRAKVGPPQSKCHTVKVQHFFFCLFGDVRTWNSPDGLQTPPGICVEWKKGSVLSGYSLEWYSWEHMQNIIFVQGGGTRNSNDLIRNCSTSFVRMSRGPTTASIGGFPMKILTMHVSIVGSPGGPMTADIGEFLLNFSEAEF